MSSISHILEVSDLAISAQQLKGPNVKNMGIQQSGDQISEPFATVSR